MNIVKYCEIIIFRWNVSVEFPDVPPPQDSRQLGRGDISLIPKDEIRHRRRAWAWWTPLAWLCRPSSGRSAKGERDWRTGTLRFTLQRGTRKWAAPLREAAQHLMIPLRTTLRPIEQETLRIVAPPAHHHEPRGVHRLPHQIVEPWRLAPT